MNNIVFFWVFYPLFEVNEVSTTFEGNLEQGKGHEAHGNFDSDEKNNEFWYYFQEELKANFSKFEKKVWTKEEDDLLFISKEKGLDWHEISELINGTNHQVCKRRYYRLKNEENKWSKDLDNFIKHLVEVERKKWKEIFKIIETNFNITDPKRQRDIKSRYELHLSSKIIKQAWTLEEDIQLYLHVGEYGHKWNLFTSYFKGRTELQLKNRYYGTLVPIEKRSLRKIAENNKQK